MKLDRNKLLENENYSSDCRQLYCRNLALEGKVDTLMDNVIKLLIVDVCECVQKENVER